MVISKTTYTAPVFRLLATAVVLLFYFSATAQSKKMKAADALYNKQEYIKAIEAYKEVLKDNPATPGVKSKIANSYRLTGSFSAAQKYYADVVTSTEKQPTDIYHYAECLRINGEIENSKKWYEEYIKTTPGDTIASKKLAVSKIYLDSAGMMKCSSESISFSSPDGGKINVPVVFDASKTEIKGEKTKEYFWDFDNNSVTTGNTVKHAFSENRPHTIRLYIVTEKGTGLSVYCASKTIDIKPGYKPGSENLLNVQKQDAELREKATKKQQ